MRRISRPKVFPPTLTEPGKKGYEQAKAQREGTKPRDDFPAHWRENDVRGVLRAMCGLACAYCLDVIGRTGEDVEHFRPKHEYWWLAYSVDNYLPACRRCNSSRKGKLFPLEAGAARASVLGEVHAEKRLLLDPVVDKVEDVLRIDVTGPDLARYAFGVVSGAQNRMKLRGQATIDFFHLNDDTELSKLRIQAINDVLTLIDAGTPATIELARRKMSRYERFGGAVRNVVAQVNPSLAPTVEEETRWLAADLLAMLELFGTSARPDEKPWEITRYALAALWRDPPTGVTPKLVAGWLEVAGRKEEIRPYYDSLAEHDEL